MVIRRPVVSISGLNSQLPDGDTIEGGSLGNLIAGSGIVEGSNANLSLAVDVSVSLAPNPSGVIFVGNKYLGDDGVAQTLASLAVVSGVYATEVSVEALASGAAAVTLVNTAVASGTAAATDIQNTPGGAGGTYVAATDLLPGYAVGLNQQNQVEAIRYAKTTTYPKYYANSYVIQGTTSFAISATYNTVSNDYVYVVYCGDSNVSNYGIFVLNEDLKQASGPVYAAISDVVYLSAVCSYNIIEDIPGTEYAMVSFQNSSVGPTQLAICYANNGSASAGTPSTSVTPFISAPQCMAYDKDIGDMLLVIEHTDPSLNGLQFNFNQNSGDSISSISAGQAITSVVGGALENECAVNYITESGTYQGNGYYIFAYSDADNSFYGTARIYTRTGSQTSMSANNKYVFESRNTRFIHMASESGTRGVITYTDVGVSGYAYAVTWSRSTLVSTGLTFSNAIVINDQFMPTPYRTIIKYSIPAQKYVVTDQRSDGQGNYMNKSAFLTVDTANNNLPVIGDFVTGTYGFSPTPSTFLTAAISQKGDGQSYFAANYSNLPGVLQTATSPLLETVVLPQKTTVQSDFYVNNFLGIAKTPVASGSLAEVGLQTTVQPVYSGLQTGFYYYLDPATSGIFTNSSVDPYWYGFNYWKPVGRALSSTDLLVISSL